MRRNSSRYSSAKVRLAWMIAPLWLGLVEPAWPLTPAVPDKAPEATAPKAGAVVELEWDALLPEQERLSFASDVSSHDYLSEQGPRMEQGGSFATNPKLDGAVVKLPGFVVPLSISGDGTVREFFLVPYFGACIHIPPPPPNQIVYVKTSKGFKLTSIYDPQWVTGILHSASKDTPMASAAYTLDADKIEQYDYEQ